MEPDGLIGKRLAAARKEVHLSQQALAAELGVSLRTVQNYEAGKFVPYRHLDALSRLLGRSPAWLLYGSREHDSTELRARSRQQRLQLQQNVERLVQLRDRLVESAGGGERPGRRPPEQPGRDETQT